MEHPVGPSTADSHRNRSRLHRLSLMWPRNVSQEGLADSGSGSRALRASGRSRTGPAGSGARGSAHKPSPASRSEDWGTVCVP